MAILHIILFLVFLIGLAGTGLSQSLTAVFPKTGQNIFTSSVNFTWNPLPGASSHRLTISRQADLGNPVHIGTVTGNTSVFVLPSQGAYFWQVSATDANGNLHTSPINSFFWFSPAQIPGLVLWLDAAVVDADGSGRINRWLDRSPQGNHVLQNMPASMPTHRANSLNNHPVVTFDGMSQFLDGGDVLDPALSSMAIFVVSRALKANSSIIAKSLPGVQHNRYALLYENNNLYYLYHDNALRNISIGRMPGQFEILSAITSRSQGMNSLFVNGIQAGQAPINPAQNFTSAYNFLVGAYNSTAGGLPPFPGYFLQGDIAEVLMYFHEITPAQRMAIERYKRHKYFPAQHTEPVCLGLDRIQPSFCRIVLDAGAGFTSYAWNTGATTRTITPAASGTYRVTVTDVFGFTSSDEIVVQFPIVRLNYDTVSVCAGETVELSLIGSQPGFSYRWNTGATTPSIRVSAAGTYTLAITDAQGCSTELSATVLIDDFSRLGTLGADRPFCLGDTLRMEHSAGAVSFLWSTGATTPAITITQPGTYWVHATSETGCVARDTVTLSFGGHRPTAHFTATNACPGQPISFTDRSTVPAGSVVSWRWDFHDGQTSVERNPVHTPTRAPGTAPVTLQVTTDVGCRHSVTLPVRVFHNPQVSFTPHHACTMVPQPFTDTSTDPDGIGITSRSWLFPDGSTDTTRNASFIFEQTGSFPVTLQVTTAAGCTALLNRSVLVRESPRIDFSWTTACKGEQVHFTELGSAPAWAPITAREWNFGDGNTSTRTNPGHTFPADGVFPVTLTLTAANGCRISLTRDVTVHSIPRVDFAIADLCEGMPHRFTDQSTVDRSTITRWRWNFDNLGTSTLQHPDFAFDTPGQYSVRLEVESAAGCINATTRQVQVYPAPTADFSFWPDMGASPLQVAFTNTSAGAAGYLWDFGDGSPPSTLPTPVHTFLTDGRFTVQLIATSQRGCTDTLRRELRVVPIVMDVAVTQVAYTMLGGFMQITANLLNLGTRTLDTLMLDLNLEGRRPIRERWTGRLHSGDITSHTFNAMLPMRPNEQPTFICVAASTGTWLPPDRNPGNNTRCLSFNEAFQLLDPRPNPVASQTELPIVLPVEKLVHVALYDLYGNRLWEQPGLELEKGVNFITIPMHTLRNGIYMIHVRTNEETRTKRVMKMQ